CRRRCLRRRRCPRPRRCLRQTRRTKRRLPEWNLVCTRSATTTSRPPPAQSTRSAPCGEGPDRAIDNVDSGADHMPQPSHSDDTRIGRPRERLAKNRECQLLAALIPQLRTREHRWWTPEHLRRTWPTPIRFDWLDERPDVRGRLTHKLT